MKKNLYILLFTLFSTSLAQAQLTGSAKGCAGLTYTYSVTMPGATSFTWSVPAGWYALQGQGTSSIQVNCNVNVGSVCVTGYDAGNNVVNTLCQAVTWGGGSGWLVTGTQQGDCAVGYSYILNLQPTSSCGIGDCGNGIQSPNVFYAAFDDVWPDGQFYGIVNGSNPFYNYTSGGFYLYIYKVDSTFGMNNLVLVEDGGAGCSSNNAYFLAPAEPEEDVTLIQQPSPACIGSRTLITSPAGTGLFLHDDSPGVTVFNSPDSVVIIIKNDSASYINGIAADNGCPVYGGLNLNYIDCDSTSVITDANSLNENDHIFSLSPNPVSNELTIQHSGLRSGTINIFDVPGRICYQSEIKNLNSKTVIDVSMLPPGVYFIQLMGEKESLMGRFVKE